MSYAIEKMDPKEAWAEASSYQYALRYEIGGIFLEKTADICGNSGEECMEVRFFDAEKELHIYEDDGEQHAVKVTCTGKEDCQEKRYLLQERYAGIGKYLCVCEHLGYDEDGQAAVELTRLTGIA